ncbi:Flp pilus assembly complex ATPase component TadA [bacterium]|nr:Flp pilus assembly complex ATPase component TadA [bacterium]
MLDTQKEKQGGMFTLLTALDSGKEKRPATETFAVLVKKGQEQIQEKLSPEEQRSVRTVGSAKNKALEVLSNYVEGAHLSYVSQANPSYAWPDGTPDQIAKRIFLMLYSLGPIQRIVERGGVEDIAINGPKEVCIRTADGWKIVDPEDVQDLDIDPAQLIFMFNQQIAISGRQAGPLLPIIDDQIEGGHRLNLIVQPVAQKEQSPVAVIRVHRETKFTMKDFLERPVAAYPPKAIDIPDYLEKFTEGAFLTPASAHFLHQCVYSAANLLTLGRTGVGKTAFLSALGGLIPSDRRVLVCEDTRELRIREGDTPRNVVYLTTSEKKLEGGIEIQLSQLIKTALRLRPDHLIVGESRGEEILDLLNAMQTGHGGNLTSVHALHANELIQRVKLMIRTGGVDLDDITIANMLAISFHVIVTLMLDFSGRRWVKEIAVFTGRVIDGKPEVQYVFQNGPESDFRLTLATEKLAIEPLLNRNGLTFNAVVEIEERDQRNRR